LLSDGRPDGFLKGHLQNARDETCEARESRGSVKSDRGNAEEDFVTCDCTLKTEYRTKNVNVCNEKNKRRHPRRSFWKRKLRTKKENQKLLNEGRSRATLGAEAEGGLPSPFRQAG
jgi:hypothetical protein